jgi:FAD synthase
MNIYDHFSSKDVVNSEIDISCIGAFDGLHLGHLNLSKVRLTIVRIFKLLLLTHYPKYFLTKN